MARSSVRHVTFVEERVSKVSYDSGVSIDLRVVSSSVSPRDRASLPATPHAIVDEDGEDARRAAARDVNAFERLHGRHARRVYRLARRFLDRGDADDATQDIFVRAWDKLALFRGEASFGTWLHRLAMNVILRRAEQSRRRARRHVGIDETVGDRLTLAPEASDARTDIDAALSQLDDGLRKVVVLHDMEGFSHAEIAGMLGITVGGSRMRLHRARMALRVHVRKQD